MKLAFSTVACPTLDLGTILDKAAQHGFDGVEIRVLQGQLNLTLAPELTADPEQTRARFKSAGVELMCLSSSAAFHMRDPQAVADQKAQVRDYVDTAAALGCPYVRVFAAEIPKRFLIGYERRDKVLCRIAGALRDLVSYAESRRVTLVLENAGDFCGSEDLWFLVDAAGSPAVQACWNTLAARSIRERPTISIPRLGCKIALVHAADAKFDEAGHFDGHVIPGQGDCELDRMFELLKGTGFDGWLVFDWPKLWNSGLPDADRVLPQAAAYFRGLMAQQTKTLTAYKGDKHAPKYRNREPAGAP